MPRSVLRLSAPCPFSQPLSNQAVLAIASADLAGIAPGTYALTVTATNFLGVNASSTRQITIAAAGTAPVISIVGGPVQDYTISEGFKVSSQLVAESVCAGTTVSRPGRTLTQGFFVLPGCVRSAKRGRGVRCTPTPINLNPPHLLATLRLPRWSTSGPLPTPTPGQPSPRPTPARPSSSPARSAARSTARSTPCSCAPTSPARRRRPPR
jgi:hypothetical protein